ncbi:unnamed protein product [Chondrus crispus]|uniref:Uncharacterized protein n=1 Tax=Chondrus crispus TaxID=2769 RepID=R7QGR6_CHOCR|nr:unnamed protein product [Chondrus crispus]CDF36656.1 unnamed protein product [Chondrus crispus]|eukprot:XP_005716475.1 unnamed protein product [Chondrus crispus]
MLFCSFRLVAVGILVLYTRYRSQLRSGGEAGDESALFGKHRPVMRFHVVCRRLLLILPK